MIIDSEVINDVLRLASKGEAKVIGVWFTPGRVRVISHLRWIASFESYNYDEFIFSSYSVSTTESGEDAKACEDADDRRYIVYDPDAFDGIVGDVVIQTTTYYHAGEKLGVRRTRHFTPGVPGQQSTRIARTVGENVCQSIAVDRHILQPGITSYVRTFKLRGHADELLEKLLPTPFDDFQPATARVRTGPVVAFHLDRDDCGDKGEENGRSD